MTRTTRSIRALAPAAHSVAPAAHLGLFTLALLLVPALADAQRRTDDPIDPGPMPVSAVGVSDNLMMEGDEGAAFLRFNLSIQPASDLAITLNYRVLDRTARGDQGDYQAVEGSVTIPPGVTQSEIPVTVFGDQRAEADEIFQLELTSAVNANIVGALATGTIQNDDLRGGGGGPRHLPETGRIGDDDPPGPTEPSFGFLNLVDNTMREGHEATAALSFRVRLSQASDRPVTVAYRLYDRSAHLADNDYQGAEGVVTIPAHITDSEIGVIVYGDRLREGDESFLLMVTSVTNAHVIDGVAVGTINNDDFQGGGGGDPRHLPEIEAKASEQASAKKVTWGELKSIYR
jgi:hypothetical protein